MGTTLVYQQAAGLDMEGCGMTDSQFLVLLGTVWIAPHSHPFIAHITCAGFIIVAACKGLGWL
jgi:hypothetical protein